MHCYKKLIGQTSAEIELTRFALTDDRESLQRMLTSDVFPAHLQPLTIGLSSAYYVCLCYRTSTFGNLSYYRQLHWSVLYKYGRVPSRKTSIPDNYHPIFHKQVKSWKHCSMVTCTKQTPIPCTWSGSTLIVPLQDPNSSLVSNVLSIVLTSHEML